MASRMISVRTLQHPAGTDGCSTWSAEAPSVWVAKHNDCFRISAAPKGSSIHLSFHGIWYFTLQLESLEQALTVMTQQHTTLNGSVPWGRSNSTPIGNNNEGNVRLLAVLFWNRCSRKHNFVLLWLPRLGSGSYETGRLFLGYFTVVTYALQLIPTHQSNSKVLRLDGVIKVSSFLWGKVAFSYPH